MAVFLWDVLSEEWMGLCIVYAAGSYQRSLSRVQVLSDSRPYFTVSDLRLPLSSPPTRRVTVEVFDTASIRKWLPNIPRVALYSLRADRTENSVVLLVSADRTENISRGCYCCVASNCRRDMFTLRSNRRGAATLSTVACVLKCLLSHCLDNIDIGVLGYIGIF
jgi:hypothetical protein